MAIREFSKQFAALINPQVSRTTLRNVLDGREEVCVADINEAHPKPPQNGFIAHYCTDEKS